MKIIKRARFRFGYETNQTSRLSVLLGWENKRFRLDYATYDNDRGWIRLVSTAKAWKIDTSGAYVTPIYYFRRTWVH